MESDDWLQGGEEFPIFQGAHFHIHMGYIQFSEPRFEIGCIFPGWMDGLKILRPQPRYR